MGWYAGVTGHGDRGWGSQKNPTVEFSLIIGLDCCLASGDMLERQVYPDWGGNHESRVVGLGMLVQRMRVRTLMPSQRSGLGTRALSASLALCICLRQDLSVALAVP